MQKRTRNWAVGIAAVTAVVSLSGAGCLYWVDASQGSIFIETAVRVKNGSEGCQTDLTDVLANGVLDIGAARPYTGGVVVTTNLPSTMTTGSVSQDQAKSPNYPNYGSADANVVQIRRAYVQFTDGDTDKAIPDMPAGRDEGLLGIFLPGRERVTPTGGVIRNEQTQLGTQQLVFFTALTEDESAILRNGAIGAGLGDPGKRKRILANVFLEGQTTGASPVRSTTFSFPIDLCRGCLIPEQCPDDVAPVAVAAPDVCALLGQDVAQFVCAN